MLVGHRKTLKEVNHKVEQFLGTDKRVAQLVARERFAENLPYNAANGTRRVALLIAAPGYVGRMMATCKKEEEEQGQTALLTDGTRRPKRDLDVLETLTHDQQHHLWSDITKLHCTPVVNFAI